LISYNTPHQDCNVQYGYDINPNTPGDVQIGIINADIEDTANLQLPAKQCILNTGHAFRYINTIMDIMKIAIRGKFLK
jgi:hypothetical protein